MSAVMFENILKELSNLISENDLHVSQVYTPSVALLTSYIRMLSLPLMKQIMFSRLSVCLLVGISPFLCT